MAAAPANSLPEFSSGFYPFCTSESNGGKTSFTVND